MTGVQTCALPISGVVSARRPRIPRPGRGHRNFIEYIPVQLDSDTDEYNDFEEDELEASNIKDYKPIRGYKSKSKYYTAKGKGAPTPKSIERKYTSLEYNDYNDFEEDEDLMIEMNDRGFGDAVEYLLYEPEASNKLSSHGSRRKTESYKPKARSTPTPKLVVRKYPFLKYNDFEEDELEASNIKDYKPIRGYKSKSKYYTAKGKGAPTPKSIERKYTSLEYNDYNDFEEDEDLMIEMNGRGPRGLRPVRGNLGVVSHEPITSHSKGFRSSIRFPFWIKMTPTPKPKSVVGKYTFLDYNDFE